MTFWHWLGYLIRIAAETVILGFAWRRSDWSVALMLTMLTLHMECRTFSDHRNQRNRDQFVSEDRSFTNRIRNM